MVDNFIYRVEALTHQTLEGNFSVLCSNAIILFDGKALAVSQILEEFGVDLVV